MLAKRYTSRKDRETGKLRSDTLHITDSDFDTIDSNCSPADSEANAVFAIVELHAACAVVDRIFLWVDLGREVSAFVANAAREMPRSGRSGH